MPGFEELVPRIWTLAPERDDEGCVHEETAQAVPLLIDLLRSTASDRDDRGRAALLLGLIAEGRGTTPSATARCRSALREGVKAYLAALGGVEVTDPENESLVAALAYLLAHFPEDAPAILDALGGAGDPAFAQMRRVFDPPGALRRIGGSDEIIASTLAEMGARAASALPLPGVGPGRGTDVPPPAEAGGSTAGLAQRLMEDRALVKLYESHMRPQFLRVMGGNWADELTPEDEDAYIRRAPAPGAGPVLDLACGAGRWTRVVAEKVGAARVIGLDLSRPMLLESRAFLPAVCLVRGDALRLPFADGTLGGVNCFNALQVLSDPERAIREIGRCLARDGVLTCFSFRRAPRGVYRYFQSRFERATKVRAFRDEDVRRWLADAGMLPLDVGGPSLCLLFTARRS